jgi:hypothetical protein
MLRRKGLDNAQKVARIVGQRQIGHYDHEADLVIGPETVHSVREPHPPYQTPTSDPDNDGANRGITFQVAVDAETGEPLVTPAVAP